MAKTTDDPYADMTDSDRIPLVFETYLDAHREVARRKDQDAATGIISRVEKSPYGRLCGSFLAYGDIGGPRSAISNR